MQYLFQHLSGDIKVVDRGQELVKFHLSKVGLFLQVPKAYSPRPPKEIVAHCHYSPANSEYTTKDDFCEIILLQSKMINLEIIFSRGIRVRRNQQSITSHE